MICCRLRNWRVNQRDDHFGSGTCLACSGTSVAHTERCLRALQVGGGSEFAAERANRTHTEGFSNVSPCSLKMKKLNRSCVRGRGSTTLSVRIKLMAISSRCSSCSGVHLKERNESVNNLLDEYKHSLLGHPSATISA